MLHLIKYSDDMLVADVFTRERGRVSFAVRISRSAKVAVRHTLFQPMAVLELEWDDRRTGNSLCRVRSARVVQPFCSVPYEAVKGAMALYLAELLRYALRMEPDAAAVYDFVEHSLVWLDTSRDGFANFHLVFQLRLTLMLGFYPNIEGFVRDTGYFDLRAGCFVDVRPLHPDYLEPAEGRLLPLLLRMDYGSMHLLKLSGAARSRLLEKLGDYYRLHLPDFPELKSAQVLREVFRT